MNADPHVMDALVRRCAAGEMEAFLRQGDDCGWCRHPVRQLVVEQQLITLQGRAPYLAPPKTPASVRQVPLPLTVVDAVAAHLAEFDNGVLGTVFSTEGGEPLRRNRFSERVWRPAVAKARLRPGTRFHELRHYYASLLIRHGESVKTVQARLGHASASETLDIYAHLWPDSEDRTREAVDSVLGPAVWPRSGERSLG